jgi:hypothetical protein
MRHGLRSFWETLPVGQYDFPDWLFFGGSGRSQTADAVHDLAPQLLGGASEIVHLDFHTGLGRWSEGQLLLCETAERGHADWWRTHFGAGNVKEPSGEVGAYQIRGGFGRWLQAQLPNCRYRFATAEFGTYSPTRVFQTLLRELFYCSHAETSGQQADHWTRRQLSEVFVPRNKQWRSAALSRGLSLIERATEVLRQSQDEDVNTSSNCNERLSPTVPAAVACSQTA